LLINGAIYNKKLGLMEEIWSEIDWRYVKDEAYQHNCMALIFPSVKRIQEQFNCIDKQLFNMWETEVEEMVDTYKNNNKRIQEVVDVLKSKNIEVTLFKGAVLAHVYPVSQYRNSWDIDLYVDKVDKDAAISELNNIKYVVNEDESVDGVIVLEKDDTKIDLHTDLWNCFNAELKEKLEKLEIENKKNHIDFVGEEIKCKTFNATKQFEYLFLHMMKHFKENGIGIRHLIDVTLFYDKYKKEIDVDLVRTEMNTIGCISFYEAMCSLCIAHLGMNRDAIVNNYIIEPHIYDKLLNDIFDAGAFGEKTVRRIKFNKMKEKMNNKSFASKIKNRFKKSNVVSESYVTNIEKERAELIRMLEL